jgi:Ca-activated chloride channel family protein
MPRILRFLSAAAIALIAASSIARAQLRDRAIPCNPPPCPPDARCAAVRPCFIPDGVTRRISSQVRAVVDGRVIKYEIEDRFVNNGNRVSEVDYMLPLPKGAAFENLELSINGEMIAGETMRAERARAIYEEIVRKMRDPALVEWMGHDLLRTRIFPIQPGEEKRVIVRFSAVAQRESEAYRIDWPARAMANARTDDDWFELRYAMGGSPSLGEAYSPTHNLTTTNRDREMRTVRTNTGARAMTLLLPARRESGASLALLPYAVSGEDGYALITVTPPARVARTSARDITFVLDVSGSMAGEKMVQARAAGRQFLNSLERDDRFRIIAFSGDVRDFREGWSPVTRETIRAATNYLDDLRPLGSTNIDGALTAALAESSPRDRIPLVLFLTDGAPTVGETRPEAIASHAADRRGRARVFTFGLGADLNAQLLEQLALQGRGTATFLRPNESVERAVGVVTERLTTPVATDVTLRVDEGRLYAIQPQSQIDIFAGQDLVVLARYSGNAESTTLTVEGRGPDGPVRWTQRVRLPRRSSENSFVGRLWAVQRVGWLSAERRRNGGNSELDAELRQLGERYGIPTELTSYLVVEPGMNTAQFRANTNDLGAVQGTAARDRAQASRVGPPQLQSAQAGGQGAGQTANAPASVQVQQFETAKLSSEQRAIQTLGDERQASINEADAQTKIVGNRAFRADKDGKWVESKKEKASRVISVKAYSEAYFAILKELPEIAQLLTVGEKVRIEGRAVAIEIVDSGLSTIDAQALATLVRDWR